MNYTFSASVKEDDKQRAAFNKLTSQTFGFDFRDWYDAGHWGNLYIPHTLFDGDKAISNVSVNLMQFQIGDERKNYIQLGTVMTDEAYRGQGLNRWIMERVLEEYAGKVDGIYLFGNDSVLDYYPRFGFQPAKEYEYYLTEEQLAAAGECQLEKVDMSQPEKCECLYDMISSCAASESPNPNDGMYMNENLNLYQFWMTAGYGDNVYYLPEKDVYVIAELDGQVLRIHQIFGKNQVDIAGVAKELVKELVKEAELADAGRTAITEVVLGFTPAHKELFSVREHKEEDCTLFVLGEDLQRVEREKLMFPVLSHA